MNTLEPAEIEYVCESTNITIIPSFKMDKLHFISGSCGPFKPARPVEVPLWLALVFKKRQRCKIQPPEFMELDNLQKIVDNEKRDRKVFQNVPPHFVEVSLLLLESASDDIVNPSAVRILLEDLREIRKSKIRDGLQVLSARAAAINLNELTLMELNEIRAFFLKALDEYFLLRKNDPVQEEEQLPSGSSSSAPSSSSGSTNPSLKPVRHR